MTTLLELLQQRNELNEKIEQLKLAEKAVVVKQIQDQIEQYALTVADLFPAKTRGKSKKETKTVAPKYRDPASGAQWSGRGVAPIWIKGQDREKFLIE